MNHSLKTVLILPLIFSTLANAVTLNNDQKLMTGLAIAGVSGSIMLCYSCISGEERARRIGLVGLGMLYTVAAVHLCRAGYAVGHPYLNKKMTWMVKKDALDNYAKFVRGF